MKKRLMDRVSDIIIPLIRPIVIFFLKRTFNIDSKGIKIYKKRDPFIVICNHITTWDAFIVMNNINHPVRFLATEISFLDFMKKISMGYLAQTIKKRVGKPDLRAVKKLYKYLDQGYAIGLFPEGDDTFYGETLEIYDSTGRLLKKAGVDVILVKQKGSHLSHPRWADNHAKRGKVFTESKLLFTKEQMKNLSAEEIQEIVTKELYHNEYDWQREKMLIFKRKNPAEGIERLIYFCNKCHSVLTVYGKEEKIECSHCGTIGKINDYGFIEGNTFDNLVDYNKYQYKHIEEVINSEFSFDITLNIINFKKIKNIKKGKFTLRYKDKKVYLDSKKNSYVFELKKIKYPVNTMKSSFSFDYEDISYNLTDIRHQFVLFEMCRYLNGSYKTNTRNI